MHHELTDEEWEAPLDAQTEADIARAIAEARDFHDDEVASSVEYLRERNLYLLVLRSGRRVAIPREELQQVCDASEEEAADVNLGPLDSSVHWEKLDIDFSVKGLADGLRGGERWMQKLNEQRSAVAA
jgi:hypothetical protein